MGLNGHLITIEVDISDGIPSYILLGLPDAALSESRDRVRSAIINSEEEWPRRKVTVSLSPAWLPKSGSSFDLPIAIALLKAQGLIADIAADETIFIGELGLDGDIRPVRGILPALLAAKGMGITRAIVPLANGFEAALVTGISVVSVSSLKEVTHFFRTGEFPLSMSNSLIQPSIIVSNGAETDLDLTDVIGQMKARWAMEIAAIGGHHMLLIGPPGAGKTMLAERMPTIMPMLTKELALDVTAVHSIAGNLLTNTAISLVPPFVAPHHTTTTAAMVGGGSRQIKPGAASLAHSGVLFIDEAPECATGVLDALRQPLESGKVTISRAMGIVTYPAKFLLILAANPCPCGRFSGKGRSCTCSSQQLRKYLQRLSGPLLDRIDIRLFVEPPSRSEMISNELGESSVVVRERVNIARARANIRFKAFPWRLNSLIPAKLLRSEFKAENAAMNILHSEIDRENISARGFHRVLRLAWSIADSEGHDRPTSEDIKRALDLRGTLGIFG